MNQFPLRYLDIEYEKWGWEIGGVLRNSLEKLTIRDYNDTKPKKFKLDLMDLPNLQLLVLQSTDPVPTVDLTLPENLRELHIECTVGKFEANLPNSLEILNSLNDLALELLTLPTSLQELTCIPSLGDFSRFSNLVELNVKSKDRFVITQLPSSLESLRVQENIVLNVDFTALPHFHRLEFNNVAMDKTLPFYETKYLPQENCFMLEVDTYNPRSHKFYSIPFSPSISTIAFNRVQDRGSVYTLCYPQTLRCLKFNKCSIGYLQNIPQGVKGLQIHSILLEDEIPLPPKIELFDLKESSILHYDYDEVRHLYVEEVDLRYMMIPDGLKTFKYIFERVPRTPHYFDLSSTEVTSFAFDLYVESGDDLEQIDYLGEVDLIFDESYGEFLENEWWDTESPQPKCIVFPPTLRLFRHPRVPECDVVFDLSKVNRDILIEV